MDQPIDNPEIIQHAHRATHEALARYASGLQGMSAEVVAGLLLGSAASVVAVGIGPAATAALLRSLADRLDVRPARKDLN